MMTLSFHPLCEPPHCKGRTKHIVIAREKNAPVQSKDNHLFNVDLLDIFLFGKGGYKGTRKRTTSIAYSGSTLVWALFRYYIN
jgi:hypothetical protein